MENKNQKKVAKGQQKTMSDYEKERKRFNKFAKVVSLVLVAVMLIFTFITAGMLIFE